jgi:hypothetical protein
MPHYSLHREPRAARDLKSNSLSAVGPPLTFRPSLDAVVVPAVCTFRDSYWKQNPFGCSRSSGDSVNWLT